MTAALEPCPNLECPGSEPVIDQHPQILTSKAVRVICLGCQTCGPLRNTESEARRLWNLLPRAPRWTSEPPTAPGWYWMKTSEDSGHAMMIEYATSRPNPPEYRFAGPIPQPPSPAERSDRP